MPKKEINYQNSQIYKIISNDPNMIDCYVGSTTNFSQRKASHKSNCKNKNQYVYSFIRENGGWNAWDMVWVENYPCANENELHARERYWIQELKATLNQIIPTRTPKEYYHDNKERLLEKQKVYYTENKDSILQYAQIYAQNNCEQISEKKKKYRETHMDEIVQKKAEIIQCECGSEFQRGHGKQRHEQSKKHQAWVENN